MTPPPRVMWTILNLRKKWNLMTPPLGPNLGKNWNVDYFEIFAPPLILAKSAPKLFDPCKNSTKILFNFFLFFFYFLGNAYFKQVFLGLKGKKYFEMSISSSILIRNKHFLANGQSYFPLVEKFTDSSAFWEGTTFLPD